MEFTIINADNFITNNWAGGTSTQLFIYPPMADYQKRNFDFRLSTAKVEIEKSDFTPLPGVSRKIIILDGSIILHHENHYSKKLNKFELDTFEGDWKTSSVGKCTDFNLMTQNNTIGELSVSVIKKNQSIDFFIEKGWDHLFIYLYSGKISLDYNNKTENLNQGDLIAINNFSNKNIQYKGIENSELIFSKISISKNKYVQYDH